MTKIAIVSNSGKIIKVTAGGPQGPTGPTGANGIGVPTGGTTNQLLAKASNSDYDTQWLTVAGTGTVTSVATGTGLTGGPITTTGTISLASTAVTPNTYNLATITVDQQGRITSASSGSAPGTDLTYTAATRLLESSTGTDVTLPLFTSANAGLVSGSGGGTSNFLRADGTWAAPVGGVTGVTATAPITSSGGSAPVISTSLQTNRLLGRTTAGTGVAEEISVGSGLSLAAGALSAPAPARAAALYFNTFCM